MQKKYLQIAYQLIITAVIFFLCPCCFAQAPLKDTIDVQLEKSSFIQGDTIAFEVKPEKLP